MKMFIVLEAFWELVCYDVFIRVNTFAELHSRVKNQKTKAGRPSSTNPSAICDGLGVACGLYPTETFCLKRSYVLVRMLRRRAVDARMIFGVQKLPFKAHAWVEVDGIPIDDLQVLREHFTVLEAC